MHSNYLKSVALCAILVFGSVLFSSSVAVLAQGQNSAPGSDVSDAQRLNVMRSRLEAMRRSLNSAIAAINANGGGGKVDGKNKTADDPRERLRGLEKEVSSIISEVGSASMKVERHERLDEGLLEKLETSIADVDARVQAGLRATASVRSASVSESPTAASSGTKKKKKKGGLFSRLLGRGGDDKYDELTGVVAPGRDRVLFEEATRQVRKGNHETGRLLFNTIISTYPDSPYLPLSKLAIADSFYLEGTSGALIQAGAAYQDWLTFFPTDPLADDVMLKMAEAEMRQMGLADRDVSHARKAEQRLKVLLQQFPNTTLRREAETRLREVQENLGTHNLQVADFYFERNRQNKGGLKGAQSRYREILEKYPNFSGMDKVLYRLGTTYLLEEEPDEAAKYFQQIARDYPNSDYAEKAREQLGVIGAEVPAPDPKRVNWSPPEGKSMLGNLTREVFGTIDITVNKNGVLISKDGAGNDLIDAAIQRGGQLPSDTTPTAPVQRRAPAKTFSEGPPTPPSKQTGGSVPQSQPSQTGGTSGGTQPAPTPQTTTPTTTPAATPGVTKP